MYAYKTTCVREWYFGVDGVLLNPMLIMDATQLFNDKGEASRFKDSYEYKPRKGETLENIQVVQFERERNGTYHYEYCGRTEYTLRGADDFLDYYYISVRVRVELINEEYELTEKIPLKDCRRASGAMQRFCNKNNGKMKWHYEVISIPDDMII